MKTVNMIYGIHIYCIMLKQNVEKPSDETNKQERDRNPPYKQDHVLLFTVNKDNWPIRREHLSHMIIIMQMVVYQPRSPAHQNFSHPSSMVLIFSKYL